MEKLFRIILSALFIVAASLGGVLFAQEDQPRVRIFPFNTPSDDPGLENLSRTATDTLVLTLQLLGEYQIERAELPSPLDAKAVFNRMREEFVDYAVYGAILPNPEGGYTITAYSWEASGDTVTVGVEMEAQSAFDLFESMDLATVRFAEEFTGIHIGFGRLVFDNRSPDESYLVEIDGHMVGEDILQREVLYGRRKITIYLPPLSAEEPYHLVSFILDIEEGLEYKVPFAIDPDIDRSDWNAAIEPPVELSDARIITSRPRSAGISAGGEPLGRTPLLIDPLFLSEGTALIAEHDYFLPGETPFTGPSLLFDLDLDPGDPAVETALNKVWLGAATNVLITGTQLLLAVMGSEGTDQQGGGPPPWPIMLAVTPRFGFVLADDLPRAGITSAASVLAAGLMYGASEWGWMETDLGMVLWLVPLWSTIFYDLIAPPFYAAADNRRRLDDIKQNGLPKIEPRVRSWISRPYVAAQAGGGAYFMAGAGIDALKEFVSFNIYAGISGDYFEPFKPIPAVTAKTLIFPAAAFDIPVRPYAAGLMHLGMNDLFVAGAVGPALGFEVPTDLSWLPPVTFFFEAEYYYSPVGAFPMIGFGGKLK